MTATAIVAMCAFALNFIAMVVGLAVTYGVMKATIDALGLRVTALESEMSALSDLKVDVAKIATRQEGLLEQFKDLNASIRWMRAPANPGQSPSK